MPSVSCFTPMAGALEVPPLLRVAVLPLLNWMIQASSVSVTEVTLMPWSRELTISQRLEMLVLTFSSRLVRRLLISSSSLWISLSSNFTQDAAAVKTARTRNNRAMRDFAFIILKWVFTKLLRIWQNAKRGERGFGGERAVERGGWREGAGR